MAVWAPATNTAFPSTDKTPPDPDKVVAVALPNSISPVVVILSI